MKKISHIMNIQQAKSEIFSMKIKRVMTGKAKN